MSADVIVFDFITTALSAAYTHGIISCSTIIKDIIIPLVRFNFFINIILSVCKYLLLRYIEMWVQ